MMNCQSYPSHKSCLPFSSVLCRCVCLWSVPLFGRRCQILRWHGLWCGSWHPEQAAWRLWLGGSDEALSHQLQSEHEHSAGAGDGPLQQPALHHPTLLCQHSEGHKGTQEELVEMGLGVKEKFMLAVRTRCCLVLNSVLIRFTGIVIMDNYCTVYGQMHCNYSKFVCFR